MSKCQMLMNGELIGEADTDLGGLAIASPPERKCQTWVWFDAISAFHANDTRHPQTAMQDLSKKLKFEVIAAEPYIVADGWGFKIEWPGWPLRFPGFIVPWGGPGDEKGDEEE